MFFGIYIQTTAGVKDTGGKSSHRFIQTAVSFGRRRNLMQQSSFSNNTSNVCDFTKGNNYISQRFPGKKMQKNHRDTKKKLEQAKEFGTKTNFLFA